MVKNYLPVLITLLFALFLLSCRDESAKLQSPSKDGGFNFGLLRYDSAALEYRLDSIHNRGLVLQFCLTEAEDNNTAFKLISYAYDTLKDHNNSWMPDTLHILTDSVPRTFSGKLTIGNNEVTREQLYNVVRDENGNRFAYDFVLFTPVVEGVFNHVVYMMTPIKGNAPSTGSLRQMTSPMPPTRVWDTW